MNYEKIASFILIHWESITGILLGVYEILIRVFPTGKNRSIIDLAWKIVNVILPNKKDDGTKRTIKCVIFFTVVCSLWTVDGYSQLVTTQQAARFGVGSPPMQGVDTTILNLNPTVYPIGTLIREINTDSLYYKFPDGFWHPIGGGGGGGGSTSPAGNNHEIQYNDNGIFGADPRLRFNENGGGLFVVGDSTSLTTSLRFSTSPTVSTGLNVKTNSGSNSRLTGELLEFNGIGHIDAINDSLTITAETNLMIGGDGHGLDTLFIGVKDTPLNRYPIYLDDQLWSQYVIDQATASTAGGTITLDQNNQFQRSFVGSAAFATPKTIVNSNVVTTAGTVSFFNFFFEVTNTAAVITVPSDWEMSTPDFDGTDWTPPATGRFEFGGSYDNVNDLWNVKVDGPTQN